MPRQLTKRVNDFVVKNKNRYIVEAKIAKKPISSFLDKAINLISLGKWNEQKSSFRYTDIFHTFLICKLDDGSLITIQKNASVEVENFHFNKKEIHSELPISLPKVTLKQFLLVTKDKIGEPLFYDYDPSTNCCQHFIFHLISSHRPVSKSEQQFIFQDVSKIFNNMPTYVHIFCEGTTDFTSFWEVVLNINI